MNGEQTIRARRNEAGIALLISIFILLLISVIAIALIVSSGTESALAGNYRSSTGVYYAAVAGLEEARARLRATGPNSFKTTDPNFLIPFPGAPLPIGAVGYVLNPGPNDTLANMLATYPDSEYDTEFGPGALAAATLTTTPSVWNQNPLNTLAFPAPAYKWVRINAVSEKSMNLDVDADGLADSTTALYYDDVNLRFSNNGGTSSQLLELTALAVLPNGSQRLLQYLVTPTSLNLTFQAALTLNGNNVQFVVPNTTNFFVNGIDQGSVGSCNPGAAPVAAVGYTNGGDSSQTNIVSAIQTGPPTTKDRTGNYTNGSPPTPNVSLVTLSPNLTTVDGLNTLVQTITQNADVVINGNACVGGSCSIQTNLPAAMSSTNPMTIVVNGDLTFNRWHATGYGLLLVTGDPNNPASPAFTYDPDASWDGIVLVIGKGSISSNQNGNGSFLGAVFLARTRDASNNPLPSGSPLGAPFFDFTSSSGSNGIYYSNCWIQASIPATNYKILSFHEIPAQ